MQKGDQLLLFTPYFVWVLWKKTCFLGIQILGGLRSCIKNKFLNFDMKTFVVTFWHLLHTLFKEREELISKNKLVLALHAYFILNNAQIHTLASKGRGDSCFVIFHPLKTNLIRALFYTHVVTDYESLEKMGFRCKGGDLAN